VGFLSTFRKNPRLACPSSTRRSMASPDSGRFSDKATLPVAHSVVRTNAQCVVFTNGEPQLPIPIQQQRTFVRVYPRHLTQRRWRRKRRPSVSMNSKYLPACDRSLGRGCRQSLLHNMRSPRLSGYPTLARAHDCQVRSRKSHLRLHATHRHAENFNGLSVSTRYFEPIFSVHLSCSSIGKRDL